MTTQQLYRQPATLLQGAGISGAIGQHLEALVGRRVLVVSDRQLQQLGLLAPVIEGLEAAGRAVAIFTGVEPEPAASTVAHAVAAAHDCEADTIIGLGGGSVMDVAKLTALFANSGQPIESSYGVDNCIGSRLPLIQIPTTAGTGSEATWVAVVTSADGAKAPIVAPQLLADAVVVDALLTVGLPPRATAGVAIDAMVHAIEAYTSSTRKNAFSDQLALTAMEALWKNLPRVIADPRDIAAREAMLVGAMQAGMAFANASVGGVHALAYPVGAQFHVAHGESNALMVAAVMRFNRTVCVSHYAEIARIVGLGVAGDTDDDALCDLLINELEAMVVNLGLPARLSQVGIGAGDIDQLVAGAVAQARLLAANARLYDSQAIRDTYLAVL